MSTGVWASGVALLMLYLCIMAVLRSSRVCQVFRVEWRNDWGTRVHLTHCWKQPQSKTRISVDSAITYGSTSAEDGKAFWLTSAVAVWKESSNSSAFLNLVYLRSPPPPPPPPHTLLCSQLQEEGGKQHLAERSNGSLSSLIPTATACHVAHLSPRSCLVVTSWGEGREGPPRPHVCQW